MDKTVINKIKKYSKLTKKLLDVEEVILYGSYAKGLEKKDSDIDIAIVVNDTNGNYLEKSAELFNITRKVDVRIEPVLLKKNDKSGFLDSIEKYGIVVYKK